MYCVWEVGVLASVPAHYRSTGDPGGYQQDELSPGDGCCSVLGEWWHVIPLPCLLSRREGARQTGVVEIGGDWVGAFGGGKAIFRDGVDGWVVMCDMRCSARHDSAVCATARVRPVRRFLLMRVGVVCRRWRWGVR